MPQQPDLSGARPPRKIAYAVANYGEPARPFPEEVAQLDRYAGDLARKYPGLVVRRHVVYTIGAQAYRFFSLEA